MIYIVTGILFILLIIVESISEVLIRVSITDKPFGFIKDKSSQLLLGVIGYIFVALLYRVPGSFSFLLSLQEHNKLVGFF